MLVMRKESVIKGNCARAGICNSRPEEMKEKENVQRSRQEREAGRRRATEEKHAKEDKIMKTVPAFLPKFRSDESGKKISDERGRVEEKDKEGDEEEEKEKNRI